MPRHTVWARRVIALGCVALPVLATAQVQPDADAAVVVTGTRLPVSATGLAQGVTVIDPKEIAQLQPARLEDPLARVTGA
jgi:outer membrane cobalamin receptor